MDSQTSIIIFDIKKNKLIQTELIGVIEKIYYLEARVPSLTDVKEYIAKYTDDISEFFSKGIDKGIKKIKKLISTVDDKIPMYDIYTKNIYLVERSDLYNKVVKEFNRFPDQHVIDMLKRKLNRLNERIVDINNEINVFESKMKKKNNLHEISKEEYIKFEDKKLNVVRTHYKISLGLAFMESFNIKVLYNTYVQVFYKYTKELGKDITICKRPSFTTRVRYLTPYYTKSEIVCLAKNMGIIKNGNNNIVNIADIDKLCYRIIDNDISANVLIDHQMHIIKNKMIGLVQYYSLQGSYFMNQYLRGTTHHEYKNEYLESLIKPMWSLINTAPQFDKDYILYRFLQTDDHLSYLEVGDIYTEKSFTSTTRDPFYQNDEYKFGWNLIKIKLPAKQSGIALCIESVSYFPKEQEIILSPSTKFKLLSKNDHGIYHHIDSSIGKRIKSIYEFEVVGHNKIEFPEKSPYEIKEKPIDFLKIKKIEALTIEEKIHQFISQNIGTLQQFETIIGGNRITVISEWYDGTGVYKKYYASQTKNGYSMYTLYRNHLLFIIEIGELYNVPFMYVNYHVKYSTLDRDDEIGSDNFLNFIASVAYYFDISNVVLYADYVSCDYVMTPEKVIVSEDGDKLMHISGGTFCTDFYDYLKTGTKKYSKIGILGVELVPKFKYHQIDLIKKIVPKIILEKFDEHGAYDQLFILYSIYKEFISENNDTMANFYIWLVENHCFLVDNLIEKFNKIQQYVTDNPFQTDYYIFHAINYLYNKGIISSIPTTISDSITDNILLKTKGVRVNRYRIIDEQRRR